MKAVILAAGEGTRLRPFTDTDPKVMLPVANKPILQYVVEALVENGIDEIVMVVGYGRQRIMSYFGDGDEFDAKIEYVVQEKQPPSGGTAYALYQAKNNIEDDFLVLPGDNIISKKTVSDLIENKERYSLLVTESDEPSKYGVVTLKKGGKNLKDLIEKPDKSPSHLISTSILSFPPEIFDRIEKTMADGDHDLPTVIQGVLEDKEIRTVISDGTWIDAVYPWDLLKVNGEALKGGCKQINGLVEENVVIKGQVKIGEGTRIRAGTFIEGPAVIGQGCDIGPNACIMPSTSVGGNTKIGPFSVVSNSLVMSGAFIAPHSTVEKSVIGSGVRIGTNFSTFSGKARVEAEDGFHEIDDIGVMIAEDTSIGQSVNIDAGVIIGRECKIENGKTVNKRIESGTKVL